MAIKKSELYSSLWASCDELRGGMDASQYKDYVLFMLFIKYVSDKYGDGKMFKPPVTIPAGSSFRDIDALDAYWQICSDLRASLFQPLREGYLQLSENYPLSILNYSFSALAEQMGFVYE